MISPRDEPFTVHEHRDCPRSLKLAMLSPLSLLLSYAIRFCRLRFSMNSNIHSDNKSLQGPRVEQKTKAVKSFVFGDVAVGSPDNSFTSPVLTVTRKHLINDDITDNEPSKRRKRNPWTKEVSSRTVNVLGFAIVVTEDSQAKLLAFLCWQEDTRLMALVKSIGLEDTSSDTVNISNFGKIAIELNSGRTAKQCRDRWKNYLRDGIKKGGWTLDEEELIKDMYTTFGPK